MFETMLTEADRQYLRRVEEFCREKVDPHCARWDDEENLPREIFSDAGRLGLLGLTAPADLGGRAMSFVAYARVLMTLGRHSAALAMDIAAHNALSLGHVLTFGSDGQRKRFVPKLASGEWLGAWALTEPNAGSDTNALESAAVQVGDRWELTGRKMFITQGRRSDVLVVMARTGKPLDPKAPEARPEISAFVVSAQHRQVVRKIPTYGMKSSDTAEIRFDRAPAELLGERGKGRENALSLLDRGRIGIAALAVGIGGAARDAAAAYALQRRQFARPIGDFQAVQWMLADASVDLDAAELLVLKAAAQEDAGGATSRAASTAKLFASEAATRICNKAVQVLGGRGCTRDYPVERYLRDAKICEIVEGTSEVQRLIIARQVLKEARVEAGPGSEKR
jgi:alkylation response protein AidB-like acyl-CoA dehydrogenase